MWTGPILQVASVNRAYSTTSQCEPGLFYKKLVWTGPILQVASLNLAYSVFVSVNLANQTISSQLPVLEKYLYLVPVVATSQYEPDIFYE